MSEEGNDEVKVWPKMHDSAARRISVSHIKGHGVGVSFESVDGVFSGGVYFVEKNPLQKFIDTLMEAKDRMEQSR